MRRLIPVFWSVVLSLVSVNCGTVLSEELELRSEPSALGEGWRATSSLAEERVYHSATELTSNKVLLVGGWSYNSYLATAALYDAAAGTWSATGPLATPRAAHTATRLSSGKVLVVGGENFTGYTAAAELYEPATGTWSPAGATSRPRGYSTATLLQPSGKVLIAGGSNQGGAWETVDVYDPAAGTWSAAARMREPRRSHTATLLASGKVLVTGGWGGGALATAELYDPATNTWSSTSAMSTARYDHTATLLPSGKVLVTGGQNASGALATAELYDPATATWSSTGPMSASRAFHTATRVSGKVLVAGGQGSAPLSTAEVYDAALGTWSATSALLEPRSIHTATLLSAVGRVLVTGGRGPAVLATAELFDTCTIGACTSTSCQALKQQAPTAPSGVYTLDPDGAGSGAPFEAYCEMSRDGGGWTLVMVSSEDGQATWTWEKRTLMTTNQTLVGDVLSRHKDFKSRALHAIPFRDLLFVHAPSNVWAAYAGVGNGSADVGSFMAAISAPVCNLALAGNGYPMTAGTLQVRGGLCDTDLYFHQGDFDRSAYGTVSYCQQSSLYQNSTYGPSWNINNNDGCPFDDPSFASFGPDMYSSSRLLESNSKGFGYILGLNTGAAETATNSIQMYVR